MSTQIKIELDHETEKVIAAFPTLPPRITAALVAAMDKENQFTLGAIKTERLTGRGPFPPSDHRLGQVTGRLRGSANASPAQAQGDKIDSAIGSNVIYAAVHEFGRPIHHKARQMKLRHKTDARGNLVKQLGNSNLLMFARAGHKRARETTVEAKAYDVDMPERAPFRTGIRECLPHYTASFSAAIAAEWNKLSTGK